jgi:hypothetical protein
MYVFTLVIVEKKMIYTQMNMEFALVKDANVKKV